ncbi:MAG TPA: asparagine synthase (glutamine-hydrolyzing) [Gemmatimonadales bacterium]|nr:asparagine synthase (glutamine-hydrolyzing) [Gemmatimonadales bacterium]
MCGITGLLTAGEPRGEALGSAIERMATALKHRGPDDAGIWSTESAGHAVGFGFRRLAIIDLSEQGHQPMQSAGGRFTMVFNGEVYNFLPLRRELESGGARFRGHSDSEVMLAAFERWGVEAAVRRFLGMFAIAVWDRDERALHLVRDRLGKKPLFVYSRPGFLSFGSELKALVAGPQFDRALDRDALVSYLRYLYVPAPQSIYQHVRKLEPGHLLTITDITRPLPRSRPYWSLEQVANEGLAHPFTGSVTDAVDELERLLLDAVALRLQSDVPLGALLSGGIDSSTVVALMRARATGAVKTYTIGFDVAEHDESPHAAAVARHLGTEHTALHLSGADALAVVPRLPEMFDEPFADPSQIPTFLVCQLARRDVTVALSGDGGDELFSGYNRYSHGPRIIGQALRIPRPARRLLATAIQAVSANRWDRLYGALESVLPGGAQVRLAGTKVSKIGRLFAAEGAPQMYRSLMSAWEQPADLVTDGVEGSGVLDRVLAARAPTGLLERMMLADQIGYLSDDLLAKVDRASMAVSLEARVPILDHRVVEFSWRLPRAWKLCDGVGKWLLRQVLYRYIPRDLVDRPKVGFSVPIDTWLLGPLRSWAEDLLAPERLGVEGVLRPEPITRAWRRFQGGDGSLALGLWAVLMLQAWQRRWVAQAV